MPEIRFLKVFKGSHKYNNPVELENIDGLDIIEVDSFPHLEDDITAIALVKVESKFYGQFRVRIPNTSPDYYEITINNPGSEPVWAVIKNEDAEITFPAPGEYIIDLSLDGIPIHEIILVASNK